MRLRILLLLPLLAGLSGCAFSEDVADVHYVPTGSSPLARAAALNLAVTDSRATDRLRISVKINGFGMDAASIRASRPVPDIVRDALLTEFRQRGFTVGGGDRAVAASVTQFYNTFHVGAFAGGSHGTVSIAMIVTGRNGELLYQHDYTGTSMATVILASGENAAASVAAALRDAVQKIFADPAFVGAISA